MRVDNWRIKNIRNKDATQNKSLMHDYIIPSTWRDLGLKTIYCAKETSADKVAVQAGFSHY